VPPEPSAHLAPASLQRLVPADVVLVCADLTRGPSPLLAAEAACVANAVPRRQREFAAGRDAARLALAQLGITGFALLPDAERVPRWPAGFVGSIAHCEGRCAAGVARAERVAGIGLDVEPATPLDDELHAIVASSHELKARVAGVDLGKLLFCAKEAFYKCYFPFARRSLEFRDVAIELGAAPAGGLPGTFRAALVAPGAPSLADGERALEGSYLSEGAFLFAAVTWMRRRP
jgi:4'-phosphopantetheinyl transferase EntD